MTEKIQSSEIEKIRDEFLNISDTIQLWEHYNRYPDFYRTQDSVQFLISNLPTSEKAESMDDQTRNVRLNSVILLDAIGKNSISAVNVLKVIANDNNEDRLMRSLCSRAADSIEIAYHGGAGRITAPITRKSSIGDTQLEDTKTEESNEKATNIQKEQKSGQSKVNSVAVFISRLKDEDETTWRRSAAARALGHLGKKSKDAIPVLIELVKDTDADDELRGTCADALGKMAGKDSKIINLLLKCLRDKSESPYLRKHCADTLGKIGAVACKSVPTMVRLYKSSDENIDLRLACLRAIPRMGDDASKAVPSIIKVIKNNNDPNEIRKTSIETLAKLKPHTKEHLPKIDALRKLDCGNLKDRLDRAIDSIKASV